MLTPVSKLSTNTLDYVVNFTFANKSSMNQAFPQCDSKVGLAEALKTADDSWKVIIISDRPLALLTLRTSGTKAVVNNLLPESIGSVDAAISGLRQHLAKRKVEELSVNVSEDLEETLARSGFGKQATQVRLSMSTVETELMPILPLSNPTERDLPALVTLMQESYAKKKGELPTDTSMFERILHDMISGAQGAFLAESSFISKASDKVVSACLVTASATGIANVVELFTHPLYRARGLATTEIAMSMNRLRKAHFSTLSVLVKEDNSVARRLFEKLGFKKDLRLVQMAIKLK